MVTAKAQVKEANPAKAPAKKAPRRKTAPLAPHPSVNKRKSVAAYIDACLAANDKPTATNKQVMHCCPTHHSTGPARKAAQAGEFKR